MNSNIIKNKGISSDTRKLYSMFCPTQFYTGESVSGNYNGLRKHLKITACNSDVISINSDGTMYQPDINMMGFINSADVMCGDCIFVDDDNQKVYYYNNIYELELKNYISKISINKIYDTHSTFQINTATSVVGDEKKSGVSNLYSDQFITHRKSSPSIYDSGIVGADFSQYIYIKIKSDDERYFYNGERIVDVASFRDWVVLNDVSIFYERENPIITDITDTDAGRMILGITHKNEFEFSVENAVAELCVYRNINDVLSEIKAMIIE